MDHSYFKDKLSAYLDSALEPQEMELVKRHLDKCSECREHLEKLGRFGQKIKELSGLSGDDYFEKLASKIERSIAEPQRRVVDISRTHWQSLWWKVSATAASILLVGTVSYYQWFRVDTSPADISTESKRAQSAPAQIYKDTAPPLREELFGDADAKPPPEVNRQAAKVRREAPVTSANEEVLSSKVVEREDEPVGDIAKLNAPPVSDAQLRSQAKVKYEGKEGLSAGALDSVGRREITETGITMAEQPSVLADGADDEITEVIPLLEQWQARRDTLQQLQSAIGGMGEIAADNRGQKMLADRVAKEQDSQTAYQVDSNLALVWFQVGMLTSDTTERKAAIQFLTEYQNRYKTDSSIIGSYLRQLRN